MSQIRVDKVYPSGSNLTLSASGQIDMSGTVNVTGALNVYGTTTTIDTVNMTVEDPLIILSKNASGGASVDSGLIVERGSDANVGVIWDESADQFATVNTTEDGSTAGNVSISSYAGFRAGAVTSDSLVVDTTTLVVDASNNRVGIGTASPTSTLELEASSGDIIFEMDNNASNSANFKIQNGAGDSRADLVMNDGSADTKITMKGQKVGINQTSPTQTLDVNGTATVDGLQIASSTVMTAILDEDNFASDSATALATQQSIKAYIATAITAEDLDFAGDSGTGAVDLDSQSLTIAGTANEIETSASGQTLTVGLPNNVTVSGQLAVGNRLVELASGQSTGADSGIIIERGSTGDNAAILWDESRDEFVVGTTTATKASTGDLSFTRANLSVERLGAGTEQAQAKIHAIEDVAASPSHSSNAVIIVEDDLRPAMQFVGSANNIALIQFGDNAAAAAGQLYYDHSSNQLRFNTNGTEQMRLDDTGDLSLITDSSVIKMGAGNDFTITHDGTTGATIAGNPVNITSAGACTWKSSAGAIAIDSEASTLTLDGHTGATLKSSNSGEVDITSAANVDINATTGVTIDGTTLSIDGTDDSNITVTGSAKDLDIAVAGGGTQELRLASAGTGGSAIHLNATAGGINVDSADEITIDTTSADGHIAITSAHTAGDAILISANANAGSILDVDAGILDIDVQGAATLDASSLTVTSDTATFTSANSQDPLVIIKNTTNDANAARLQFVKDKGAAGVDGDDIGVIEFVGDDAAQTQTTFAKIVAEVSEADDTDEAGKLSFFVAESDGSTTTLTAGLVLEGEHATDGEVDVTIAAGAASTTTVAGSLSVTTDFAVDGVANLDNTDVDGTFTMDGANFDVNATTSLTLDNTNTSNGVAINTATSGSPVSIGNATSETTVNDNLTVTGDLAVNGDTTTFSSANSADPLVIIKNTTNDANGARLQFVKDKGAAGADGDDIGVIEFVGDDAGQTLTTFAKIVAEVSESDDGDEAGKLSFFVAESDSTNTALTAGLILEGEHATDGEIDVTIGSATTSTATVAGNLTVTTDLTVLGGDVIYGNGQAAAMSIAETDTGVQGKALTISAGRPVSGGSVNIAGGGLVLQAGQGKGTGAGGDILFKAAPAGGSGNSHNSAEDFLKIDASNSRLHAYHHLRMESEKKVQFNDGGTYINSNADGDLDLVSDGTNDDAIKLAAAGGITLDANDASHGIAYSDGGVKQLSISHSSSDVSFRTAVADKQMILKGSASGGDVTGLTLDFGASGAATFGGKVTSSKETIFTRASVANLTGNDANATIPITSTMVNVDANGSARTGARFAGGGDAGQMLIVNVTGGENITFDNAEGTSLLNGVQAANDTMRPTGMYLFFSDGAKWNFIGGGALTSANTLQAS